MPSIDTIDVVITGENGAYLNPYVKPATTSSLGTVKSDNSSINIAADGTISAVVTPSITGTLESLITTDKSNLANAINEVKTDLQNITPVGIEVVSDTDGTVIIGTTSEQDIVEQLQEV